MKLYYYYTLPPIFLCLLLFVLWQHSRQQVQSSALSAGWMEIGAAADGPIVPIPRTLGLNKKKAELGKQLFHDPRLSYNNSISCASCHNLQTGGTDRLAAPAGINGVKSIRNTPTVFNSGFNFKQFWDGRADTLEEQLDVSVHSRIGMGANWPLIIVKLRRAPEYVNAFEKLYGGAINKDDIKNAIAVFQRSLYTPDSRFDRFLRGDSEALSPLEKEGYRRFKRFGCVSCHQGVNMGGNMFHNLGIMKDFFQEGFELNETDPGRFNVTGDEADRYTFKVPSLRNIALTAPYFHDGSAKTLEKAVSDVGKYQLGRSLSQQDITLLVKFLQTLTGKYNGEPL
ncbi:MAG: cytochrome-c peroxidase [Gammaproteobacteria bacterium]|nr:cytochrome-c peroxidase [Gammaproteobacteria bacterium]